MTQDPLTSVLADAATPQKIVFILLAVALLATLVGTVLGLQRRPAPPAWRRGMADLRCAGPLLGLFTGSLNGCHMVHTIQRLPSAPTLKDLAPGILEVSALLSLGALVRLCAVVAHLLLNGRADKVGDGRSADRRGEPHRGG